MDKGMDFIFKEGVKGALMECVEGIYVIEEKTKRICYVNSVLASEYGVEIVGQHCYDVFADRNAPCIECPKLTEEIYHWELYQQKRKQWVNIKNRLVQEEGNWYRVGNVNVISDAMELNMEAIEGMGDLYDRLDESKEKKKELIWEAYHDLMTGLYSKSCFVKDCQELFPNKEQIGIIFFDINNLKESNDLVGHEYGDKMIIAVGDILKELETENVKPYRFGGDEFVVVIWERRAEEMDEIKQLFYQRLQIINSTAHLELEVACGYSYGKYTEGMHQLIEYADAAMYRNKQKMKKINKQNEKNEQR